MRIKDNDLTCAAQSLRKIWQAHDERNLAGGTKAAADFYGLLTDANEDRRSIAGRLLMEAFFCADEAERYQGSDPDLEDKNYERARVLIEASRVMVGLEFESPRYTVTWWKGYRHKDGRAVLENLVKEHEVQLAGMRDKTQRLEIAQRCAHILIDAARSGHDIDDWDYVDNGLKKYFELYLPHAARRSH